ncbi:MAG: PKD domain-containing protein, partial [Thermoplasmata archaeon]
MNRADILKKFKGVPISYKVLAFLSVIMMTAGAYAVFVSGAAPTADLTPSEIEIYPGESVDFDASGSEGDINSYAWHFHDDNAIEMGDDLTSISHTFSDEGIYHVTLFVNASNAKMDIATSKVVVKNHAPDIVVTQDSYNVNEDEDVTFDASGSTDDSSISSYTWDFGDGDVLYGDVVTHSFTDSGSYNVNLSVEDDRGKSSFKDISVTVQNPVPTADAGDGYGIQEGRPVFLDSSDSMDNPSDTEGIRYRWSNGYVGERAMEFYGDDGSYSPSVSVRDDDDDTDNDVANVNVANTKPKVAVDGAYIKGNLTLRVAGERWHNVELWLYQSGELYGYMNVTRGVSTPQTETISDITFDLTEEWEVYAEYTPEDDPENGQPNGANPAWLILDFEGGAYRWIQHPFNVVRPDTHEWEVPLNQYFFKPECLQAPDIDQCYGNPIVHFPYKVYDQGADDLTVNWTFTDSYREEVFPASG